MRWVVLLRVAIFFIVHVSSRLRKIPGGTGRGALYAELG
jgi:hypothetical protein